MSVAVTTDGVEVEIGLGMADELSRETVYVRVARPVCDAWRETDRPTVEAAAAWVSRLTWGEVRLSCL